MLLNQYVVLGVVPEAGVEPARISPADFKSAVSTISTTRGLMLLTRRDSHVVVEQPTCNFTFENGIGVARVRSYTIRQAVDKFRLAERLVLRNIRRIDVAVRAIHVHCRLPGQ